MKQIWFLCLLVLLLILSENRLYGQDDKIQPFTIAIPKFSTEGISSEMQWIGKSFADALVTRLAQARTVRIVEREYLETIFQELKLQMSGVIDESSAVKVGKLLGAHIFIFGSISIYGNDIVVRSRTVDITKGEIIGVAEVKGYLSDLFHIQNDLARQISSNLSIDLVVSNIMNLDISKPSIKVYSDLDRLRQLSKELPHFGLDPARNRKKGEYELALSVCEKILSKYPQLSRAHYYRALFSLHNENYGAANQEINIATALNPNELDVLLLKGNIFYCSNNIQEAINEFKTICKKFPQDARAWYGLGRLNSLNGNDLQAIQNYITAIEKTPIIVEAETNLKTLLKGKNGKIQVESVKMDAPRFYSPAKLFYSLWNKEWEKTIEDISVKTIHDFPDLYIGYFMQGLAEKRKKNYENAIKHFTKCLAVRPSLPAVHREIGLLFLKNKNCSLGKQHIKIYMHSTTFVDDFDKLENAIQKCHD